MGGRTVWEQDYLLGSRLLTTTKVHTCFIYPTSADAHITLLYTDLRPIGLGSHASGLPLCIHSPLPLTLTNHELPLDPMH